MAVHGGKPKIRHKNMADGVAENGGCHGEQNVIKKEKERKNIKRKNVKIKKNKI